ncbi:hypothetical protein QN277_015420 [Acacia crassicarpa]|uniref:Uncharacterized protein n=1 Tax=Acacia crassicarpa TaxID=499986 RepID=A0AAE1MVF4_9FABA|nr:hypothetical protein QN277_015420 [Acacia crassicarpa]
MFCPKSPLSTAGVLVFDFLFVVVRFFKIGLLLGDGNFVSLMYYQFCSVPRVSSRIDTVLGGYLWLSSSKSLMDGQRERWQHLSS